MRNVAISACTFNIEQHASGSGIAFWLPVCVSVLLNSGPDVSRATHRVDISTRHAVASRKSPNGTPCEKAKSKIQFNSNLGIPLRLVFYQPSSLRGWTSAFLLAVHRSCGVIEGRLSHFLRRWLRTGWQSVISQGKSLGILRRGWELNPGHREGIQWAIPLSYHDWLRMVRIGKMIEHFLIPSPAPIF